ncbi:hypothetical protein BGZ74_001353 [Mortierella antarctica]|nr:hypothetical protein BGZ74_001353 [Mortierella antarctica]
MANNNSPSDGTRPHPSTLKSYDTNTNTLIDTLNDIECEANNNDTIAGVLNMGNVLEDDRQLALEEQGIVQKHHHNNNNDNNSSGNDGRRKSGLLHRQHGLLSSTSTNNFDSDNGSIGTGYGHKVRCHGKLMRHREIDTGKVTNMELFFDLVYVYAISAISETMVEELSWVVVLQMLIITLAIWWSWVYTAFNPDSYLVRLLLLFLMLASLILSAVIPQSFHELGLVFGITFGVLQVLRSTMATLALHGHKLQKVFIRILTWQATAAVFWIVGGALSGNARNIIWAVAVVIEYIGPMAGFYTPGLGKSISTDWEIHGGHLAERCSLFIIIALGESIVVTGSSFRDVLNEPAGVAMFVISFLGAASMWWIYFHSASNEAIEFVESSNDPGAMGRMAYTYIHFVMVLGIIWCAVADRLSIDDPFHVPYHKGNNSDSGDGSHGSDGHSAPLHKRSGAPPQGFEIKDMVDVIIIIGGPCLFVLGHALFRRSFDPRLPKAHLAAVIAMLCVTPMCVFLPRWASAVCTTGILLLLAIYESYFRCVFVHKSSVF